MHNQLRARNGVLAVRVSSQGQGIEGDSPEAQIEQGLQYAPSHNIDIVETLTYMESASKEDQPMQNVINYAIDPNNNIDVVLVKSIDRFTRGGSTTYDLLKKQLEPHNIELEDIYGVINNTRVNTLEHLGVKFGWSEYYPSRKTELLEAERAKDEVRDILSRMIGAEIRYVRMGYWIREAPFGFTATKIDTPNGKRFILEPHKIESRWVKKMFEMRDQGTFSDQEIVEKVNNMGFKTRIQTVRDKQDRTKIIGSRGGKPLSLKVLLYTLANPIYAGINDEKWTNKKPIKCKFDGLISVELYNRANRGKICISDKNGVITITKKQPPTWQVNKGVRNIDFPYKKHVMCPHCEKPLYGSASRGKLGKYYPAYHCCHRGHYFRVSKKEFEETITSYVKGIRISSQYIDNLIKIVMNEWERRNTASQQDVSLIDQRVIELKSQVATTAKNMSFVSSEITFKYMEEVLLKTEAEINKLTTQKQQQSEPKSFNMEVIMKYVKYFLEHLEYLLLQQMNPIARASYFGVLFDKAPTFTEIKLGTPKLAAATGLNRLFIDKNNDLGYMVGDEGLEPPTPSV